MVEHEKESPSLFGLRVEEAEGGITIDSSGVTSVRAHVPVKFTFFGEHLTNSTVIRFTSELADRGRGCNNLASSLANKFLASTVSEFSGSLVAKLPITGSGAHLYLCVKSSINSTDEWIHQGTDPWLSLQTSEKLFPAWTEIVFLCILLCASGLFSGLNLGLMALNKTELKIVANTGNEKEKKYARAIQPVRNHGNYLLCTLLLGNVLVNSTLTILLDDLTSGLVAVIGSTISIVLFGEIIPQALCSRHGLAVGAKTIYITKLFMLLTFPLSFPISTFLDLILGEEMGAVYNRERLKELVKVTNQYNDLEKDEVNIISGALELTKKTVSDVMTRIEDAYMLSMDTVLDFETVSDIMKNGYSRLPVYEGNSSNIVSLLYTKDLAFVDPGDNTPLKTLCEFYQKPCHVVMDNTSLSTILKEFKGGNKGHIAFVQRREVTDEEGEATYKTIGLVTLEDVLEEIIQSEIIDETDVWVDNSRRQRRKRGPHQMQQDFTEFANIDLNRHFHVSPHLTLAAFQFLSTSVEPFKPEFISESMLRRLLQCDIYFSITVRPTEKGRPKSSTYLYKQNKPADYFILTLEGHVEVTVSSENMVFESGPFTTFGVQALAQNIGLHGQEGESVRHQATLDAVVGQTFLPDYTVRAVTDLSYLKVDRLLYLAAKRGTLVKRYLQDSSQEGPDPDDDLHRGVTFIPSRLIASIEESPEEEQTPPAANGNLKCSNNTDIQLSDLKPRK